MKTILLSAMLLLGAAAGASAQPTPLAATIAEGANTIYIQTPDSAAAALKTLARLMVLKGFTVEKMDTELGYFTTAAIKPSATASEAFRARIVSDGKQPATLAITGNSISLRTSSPSRPLANDKAITYRKIAFLTLAELAKEYPSGKLSYEKR